MLTYAIDGCILTLTSVDTVTPTERYTVFQALAKDTRVPQRALVLVDARHADPSTTLGEVQERAHRLVQFLGAKLSPLCAFIGPKMLATDVQHFRAAGGQMGLRVEVFDDEPAARAWLTAFAKQGR